MDFFNPFRKVSQEYNEQVKQADYYKELSLQKSKELKELSSQLDTLDTENSEIQQKLDVLNKKDANFLLKKNSDYELQVLFSKIQDFATGIKVIDKTPNEYKNSKAFLIGLLGNFNTGKSKLASLLIGDETELEQGIGQSTKGINAKMMQDKEQKNNLFQFLDTAGCGEPLQLYASENSDSEESDIEEEKNEEISQMKEQINEKFQQQVQTDCFIQEFIITHCKIVIVTVDVMNREDQKFISSILFKMKEKLENQQVKLVVVHNFKSLSSISDVEGKIKKDIRNSFLASKKLQDGVESYLDYTYNDGNPVIHLAMAQEHSEAGNYYNMKTINFLRYLIIKQQQKTKKVNLLECILEYAKNVIYDKYIQAQDQVKAQDLQFIQEVDQENEQGCVIYYLQKLRKQYQENGRLKIKELFFDFLGRPIFNPHENTPKYDLYNSEKGVLLICDLPGIEEGQWDQNIQYEPIKLKEDNKNKLYLSIKAKRTIDSLKKQFESFMAGDIKKEEDKLITNPIHYEYQEFKLLICKECDHLDPDSEQVYYQNGQFIISYESYKKKKKF